MVRHALPDIITKYDKAAGDILLGDKAHSMIFDNSKIRALVPEFAAKIPFELGAKEIIDWYEGDVSRQLANDTADKMMDRIISEFSQLA